MWTRALREERLQAIIDNPLKVEGIISDNFLQNGEKYEGNYINAIQEFLTLEEASAIVTKLSTCSCCEVHQQKRPTELVVVEYPHSYCYEEIIFIYASFESFLTLALSCVWRACYI